MLALLCSRRFASRPVEHIDDRRDKARLDWKKLRTKLLELLQSIWEDSQEKVLIFTSLSSTQFNLV
jgi:hypothetical protein